MHAPQGEHVMKTIASTTFYAAAAAWWHDCRVEESNLRHGSAAALPDGLQLLPLCLQCGPQLLSCCIATLLYEPLRCCFPFCLQTVSHTSRHICNFAGRQILMQLLVVWPPAEHAYNRSIPPRLLQSALSCMPLEVSTHLKQSHVSININSFTVLDALMFLGPSEHHQTTHCLNEFDWSKYVYSACISYRKTGFLPSSR